MMRNNGGFLKWSLHKNNSKIGSNGKNWIHPSETLTSGHIAYLVKFLGVTEADQPKGIDVVKDCIRKLKLDEEIRRAEGGKTPKMEVTISVNGVAVQEPNTRKVLHQFPLHQISYCADDKAEKKYFSFIAKDGEVHKCFVFASEKLAEEITLTIGQAFDLAYRKFLDSSGREMELKREISLLQKRVAELETENGDLKRKLNNNSSNSSSSSPLNYEFDMSNSSFSPSSVSHNGTNGVHHSQMNGNGSTSSSEDLLICPPVPPRERDSTNVANQMIAEFAMAVNEIEKRAATSKPPPSNGLEGLFIDLEMESKPSGTTNGSAGVPRALPKLSPPPKSKKAEGQNMTNGITMNGNGATPSTNNNPMADIFGSPEPFSSDPFFTSSDPFGMTDFSSSNNKFSTGSILN